MKLTQLFSGEAKQAAAADHSGRTQLTPAQTQMLNRQIRSLAPGQTISGEIVGRNGSEVQIKLSEDMVLNARVDRNLNIEIGKNMTFEVKNNGSTLTLSPLFTNVSTDMNVLKALDMAGLPLNRNSVSMTEQLMAAGLSVNRQFLQQVFREINSFPQGAVSDIVNLHRLQMPVNEANVSQMASYRNLTHQLTEGMDTILGAMPEVLDAMAGGEGAVPGSLPGAAGLYRELLAMVQEGAGGEVLPDGSAVTQQGVQDGAVLETAGSAEGTVNGTAQGSEALGNTVQGNEVLGNAAQGNTVPGGDIPGNGAVQGEFFMPGGAAADGSASGTAESVPGHAAAQVLQQQAQAAGETLQEMLQGTGGTAGKEAPGQLQAGQPEALREGMQEPGQRPIGEAAPQEPGVQQSHPAGQASEPDIPAALRGAAAQEAMEMLDGINLPPREASAMRAQIMQFAQGQTDAGQFFAAFNRLADMGRTSPQAMRGLEKLFSGRNFRELLFGQVKKAWTVSPRELAAPGKVEELYSRMDRQLRNLAQALENAGQNGSTAFKAASSMAQNIDFMQQLNQMYAYVQLPLRFQQGEAHGELYVYSNKKKLTERNGQISALLHLDMEHLGPVDVYVALQNSRVSTRFYLRDDEMIDFIGGHMELLTERLKKRGYDCSFAMTIRGKSEDATEGGLEPILRQEKGIALSQYAFDVRT